jgi:hypothetical protein
VTARLKAGSALEEVGPVKPVDHTEEDNWARVNAMRDIPLHTARYISSAPGESGFADAYNLIAASLNGREEVAKTVVSSLSKDAIENALGAMTGIFLSWLLGKRGKNYGYPNLVLTVLREIAIDERNKAYDAHGIPIPDDSIY